MEKEKVYLLESISEGYSKGVKSGIIKDGIIIINIEKGELKSYMKYLKNHGNLKMESLLDIWGVDYLGEKERYEVNYMLLSIRYNIRMIVKIRVEEYEIVESMVGEYKSASWLEREVWDMYGVYFGNHNDMRRILTDYGFVGHPMRKDFPLSGYLEVRYDDGEKRVVQEPVEMTQEYRYFKFKSPWEEKK